jgi:hypothetical protein
MSSIKYYKIEFVERTLKLLERTFEDIKKEQGLEVTFLMNCLLGLIVTVAENEQSKNLFNGYINDNFADKIPKTVWHLYKDGNRNSREKNDSEALQGKDNTEPYLINKSYDYGIKRKDDLKRDTKYTKQHFLTKLRNAIAHQHVIAKDNEGKWVGVRMWNENEGGLIDFEIEFTIAELKDFAIYIADIYIKANKTSK